METASHIEPLEARIAPAVVVALSGLTATFTDADGDLVTIKASKPILDNASFPTSPGPIAGLEQLLTIDLSGIPVADVAGVNLTITAVPQDATGDGVKDGDGLVNVGRILANGRELGSVSLRGDLGQIEAGDGTGTALKSLSVQSIFAYGTSTGATNHVSNILGDLGSLKVARDIAGGYVRVTNGGDLGSVTVGGSLRGSGAATSGAIYADGDLGPVVVKGAVIGAGGSYSGSIGAGRHLGNVTILGSVLGGTGDHGGLIYSGFVTPGNIGAVKIGGDLRGGTFDMGNIGLATGVIDSGGKIASVTLGGSLLAYRGAQSGRIIADGDVGSIVIGGSVVGGVNSRQRKRRETRRRLRRACLRSLNRQPHAHENDSEHRT